MTPSARFESLDVLRGLAAIWVVMYHSFGPWLYTYPGGVPTWLNVVVAHGYLGVPAFFVISGFCVSERVRRDFIRGLPPLEFLADRFIRIFPVYWVALGFNFAVDVAAAIYSGAPLVATSTRWGALPGTWLEFFVSLGAQEIWLGQHTRLLTSWTLAYELGFYLVAATCLAVIARARSWWPALLVSFTLTLLAFDPGATAAFPLLAHWLEFSLGIFAWVLIRSTLSYSAKSFIALIPLLSALIWFFPATSNYRGELLTAAATCIFMVSGHRFDHSITSAAWINPLVKLGTISYSLYLIHLPIVAKFRTFGFRFIAPDHFLAFIVPVAGIMLSIAAGLGTYHLVEKQVESFRRRRLILWRSQLNSKCTTT